LSGLTNREPRLYLPTNAIPFYPDLAGEIGTDESIILVRLDCLIRDAGVDLECDPNRVTECDHPDGPGGGHTHRYCQVARKLAQSLWPWLGKETLGRYIDKLVQNGLIVEGEYTMKRGDSTRWLAINYAGCSRLKSLRVDGFFLSSPHTPHLNNSSSITTHDSSVAHELPCIISNITSNNNNGNTNTSLFPDLLVKEEFLLTSYANPQNEPELSEKSGEITQEKNAIVRKFTEQRLQGAQSGLPLRGFDYNEGYEKRFRRIVREGYVIACGYTGREALIKGKDERNITDGMKTLRGMYPDQTPTELKAMIIGFGIYFQQGLWYNTLPGGSRKTFDPPTIIAVTGRIWGKYEDYCANVLKGGIPQPGQTLP
jgi:hypothetical protein